MIAKLEPINIRYKKLILRHWARAQYSSDFHPLKKNINRINAEKNDPSKSNKSPLIIAKKLLNTEISISAYNTNKIPPGPITALPKYNIHETPTNYSVNTEPINKNNINNDDTQFYVDGSCSPNPGKGAYGWYAPKYNNYRNIYKTFSYDYPVTITRCEIMALLITIQFIKNNPLNNKNKITIYSDSKTALDYIDLCTYPKYENIRILIESILCRNPTPTTKLYYF